MSIYAEDLSDRQISMKEITEIVECPVCKGLPESFFQCENGHIGCESCLSRLQTCPVCRVEFTVKAKVISIKKLGQMLSQLRHVETSAMLLQNGKLLKIFNCTMCRFVPTSNYIFQCVDGHLYCKGCSKYRC